MGVTNGIQPSLKKFRSFFHSGARAKSYPRTRPGPHHLYSIKFAITGSDFLTVEYLAQRNTS